MCNHSHPLNAHAAGASCAAVTGLLYIVCAAAYALIPDTTLAFFNLLFHGLDIRKVATGMTWGGVIAGLLLSVIGAYVLTWLWVTFYNRSIGGSTLATSGTRKDCCK
jgi:hypothetical protein